MNTELSRLTHCFAALAVVVAAFTLVSTGQATTLVSPAGFEDVEGNSVIWPYQTPYPVTLPASVLGYRHQFLFQSSLFEPFGPGPFRITALAARPDISVNEPISVVWQATWDLTTTPRNSLSLTFDDNFGTEPIERVYSGNATFETDGVPRGDGLPHEFDYEFGNFDVPYLYDPQKGNLLADGNTSTYFDETTWTWGDFQLTGVTGQEVLGGGLNPESGFYFPGQVILQLTFIPIPEPTSALLLTVALVSIWLLCRPKA